LKKVELLTIRVDTMNNLGTLLKRLEAATSRLEDIATAQAITGTHSLSGASALHNETPRIGGNGEAGAAAAGVAGAAAIIGTAAAVEGSRASAEESSASVKGFDELVQGPLQTYLTLSQTHGGLVAQQVCADLLLMAHRCI
jgi:adenylyl cyclase-associated protein